MAIKVNLPAKLKFVLGFITDLLLIGRGQGWWSRRQGPK